MAERAIYDWIDFFCSGTFSSSLGSFVEQFKRMSLKAAAARRQAHQSAIREGLMKPVLQLFDQIMALGGFRQVTVATS
jgi:hypothetical protein